MNALWLRPAVRPNPLSPPPADPDVLDAPTYPQIAQKNLSVALMMGMSRRELILSVNAGTVPDKKVDVKVEVGGEILKELLQSLRDSRRTQCGDLTA